MFHAAFSIMKRIFSFNEKIRKKFVDPSNRLQFDAELYLKKLNPEIPDNFYDDILGLENRIQLQLTNKKLWALALKHRSFLNVTGEDKKYSNERLEFLGDSIVNMIVTQYLFMTYRDEPEGVLSKWKAILVSREVLGQISRDLGVGEYVLLNKGEEKTGGRNRISILADCFESIVGAIYLDKGLSEVYSFLLKNMLEDHKKFLKLESLKNFKSLLLEYTQKNALPFPKYEVTNEEGPDHKKVFYISVSVNGKIMGQGVGKNKKVAEQQAASEALQKLSAK